MAIETTIKKQIERHLTDKGCAVWFVHRQARYVKGKGMISGLRDIYGIWDALAMKDGRLVPIQFTSRSNMSARLTKIHKFYTHNELTYPCEIWGYRGNRKWDVWIYSGDRKNVEKTTYDEKA